MMKKDLKDKTLAELQQIVAELGQKKYLAGYIFKFIHAQGANEIDQITPLSKAFRARLIEEGYFISRLTVLESLADPDGSTKFLFELPDGERIESVLLIDGKRRTLCVSTQVGCAMGCAFCATAKIKLRRSLTAGEIADEVNAVEISGRVAGILPAFRGRDALDTKSAASLPDDTLSDTWRITNVVYMGMGEPFQSYENVLRSVRILNDPAGKNIGIRRITISTCGIAPGIVRLAEEDIQPRLAISLNAPTDALRDRIMPINRTYPLAELTEAIRIYQRKTRQRVTFEYVLIDGLNDTPDHAKKLIKCIRGILCNINLIEHNPYPGCEFKGSRRDRIAQFAEILKEAEIETTTRFKLAQNIKAACGQLQAGYEQS